MQNLQFNRPIAETCFAFELRFFRLAVFLSKRSRIINFPAVCSIHLPDNTEKGNKNGLSTLASEMTPMLRLEI